jgi:MFS family permease
MDRIGRVPVLAAGFAAGALGGVVAAIGSAAELAVPVFAGFVLIGVASGTALLARTAAGDMYPPERRAHGIALVLFGAVFGAILGPAVFSPMLHGKDLDGDTLATLWLAGSGFMVVALVLVLLVRPDPRRIADILHTGEPPPSTAVPLARSSAGRG